MPDSPKRPHRRSIRLRWYDYRQSGTYFVTVCTYNRACLFGAIADGTMQLNALGEIVQEEWSRSAVVRSNLKLDAFVIMPNHIHGLITLAKDAPVGATRRVAPTRAKRPRGPISGSIGAIIGQFKSLTAKRINTLRGTPGAHVWQRNYYEHVIRSDDEMNRAIQYITDNPSRWAEDAENPMRTR